MAIRPGKPIATVYSRLLRRLPEQFDNLFGACDQFVGVAGRDLLAALRADVIGESTEDVARGLTVVSFDADFARFPGLRWQHLQSR